MVGFPPDPSAIPMAPSLFGGFPPDPSAKAAEANDNNKNVTANIRFILVLLKLWNWGSAETPRDQFSPGSKGRQFRSCGGPEIRTRKVDKSSGPRLQLPSPLML
jgi:hypothetical protein